MKPEPDPPFLNGFLLQKDLCKTSENTRFPQIRVPLRVGRSLSNGFYVFF